MSITSYAQNFEDVLLWRALGDIPQGRYLDIGAQDPLIDSVSLAFYQAGWRGIHVEATPYYAARLREGRPDETVIEAAVTDAAGPIEFFEIADSGLSTGLAHIAERHSGVGWSTRKISVPCVRLDKLLELAGEQIHWLKIDVEGMEADVLRSWGNSDVRPWLMVVEATLPNTQQRSDHAWLDEVVGRDYRQVFFDGLSLYFVHQAHSDLATRFGAPANIFDDFSIAKHHFSAGPLRLEIETAESRAEGEAQTAQALNQELAATTERLLAQAQEQERSLRQEFQKELIEQRWRERQAAEREFEERQEQLRGVLREAEARAALREAEVARLTERAEQLGLRLGAATSSIERANAELGEERRRLAGVEAELARTREQFRQRLGEVRQIIQAVLAERSKQWQRAGEALGLVRRGPAWRELERWAASSSNPQPPPPGETTPNEEIGPTMPTHPTFEDPEQPRLARSLADLLSLDGVELVREAYLSVLGREPDREGEEYYLERLGSGRSKIEILDQLRRSDEARSVPPLPELDAALRDFRAVRLVRGKKSAASAIEDRIIRRRSVVTIDQFMRYHDEQFLAQVFAFYLGRTPDEGALSHYLPILRSGVGRQQVLLDIARSAEARKRGRHAVGERQIAMALFIDRIPIVGGLVAFVRFAVNVRKHLRELRALENHLYRLSNR